MANYDLNVGASSSYILQKTPSADFCHLGAQGGSLP